MLDWPLISPAAGWCRLCRSGGLRSLGLLDAALLGGLFDRRVAGGGPRAAALGPAWGASGGFRCRGRRPEHAQQPRKPAAHPIRRQAGLGSGPLPRQPLVAGGPAGQAPLGVGARTPPGRPVGLGGMAWPRGGPAEGLLTEPDGVLDGLIASDKFCWTRYGRLRLAWGGGPVRPGRGRGGCP